MDAAKDAIPPLGSAAPSGRGTLRLFMGYAPGVGKTTRLLEEARAMKQSGVDVVVGCIDARGRKDVEALAAPLEILPTKRLELRGVSTSELDLDAVLRRFPQVVVIDDAAHTNAPLCRNRKRTQDIEELRQAGINVLSATEVRHISRLSALLVRLTGQAARDTVPDAFLFQADELIAIDASSQTLRGRREGGLISGSGIQPAYAERLYEEETLESLRELMLREVLEHLERHRARGKETSHPLTPRRGDRVMVCLSSRSPIAEVLLHRGSRMAGRLNTTFFAVYVETPREAPNLMEEATQTRLEESIALAEELGAEVVHLRGEDPVSTLIDFARSHGVAHILLGRTHQPRWRQVLGRTFVHRMVHEAQAFDLQIVSSESLESAS